MVSVPDNVKILLLYEAEIAVPAVLTSSTSEAPSCGFDIVTVAPVRDVTPEFVSVMFNVGATLTGGLPTINVGTAVPTVTTGPAVSSIRTSKASVCGLDCRCNRG